MPKTPSKKKTPSLTLYRQHRDHMINLNYDLLSMKEQKIAQSILDITQKNLSKSIKKFTKIRFTLIRYLSEYLVNSYPNGISLFDLKCIIYEKIRPPEFKHFLEIRELYLHGFLDELLRSGAIIYMTPSNNPDPSMSIEDRYKKIMCYRVNLCQSSSIISEFENDLYCYFLRLMDAGDQNGPHRFGGYNKFKKITRFDDYKETVAENQKNYCRPIGVMGNDDT